jgi:2-polyprenyl-3-methyl-5-hydroxy-6-metoxy-1,4-benzoquinol methylase
MDTETTMLARKQIVELMDSPTLAAASHLHALRGLERINGVSRAASPFLRVIRTMAHERPRQPIRLLDVGCGGGDVPVALANAAKRWDTTIDLTLFDQSETALSHARQHAAGHGHTVRTVAGNAAQGLPEDAFDIVSCSLFLHHLHASDAIAVLRHMRRASRDRVLVSDLRRSALGLAAAQVGCRLLSRSAIVHFDGPASVRGAWTVGEVTDLAQRAGLTNALVTNQWPWRLFLHWRAA